jgi:PEP-CTERM motif
MKMYLKSAVAAAIVATTAISGQAHAALNTCASTDITPNASACAGFFSGNVLSGNSGDITAQQSALSSIGFAWDGNWNALEKISPLNGSQVINFAQLLNGTTYVAFHFGAGQGGPAVGNQGGGTAFYKFNAGTNLDQFSLIYSASSSAVLYSTGPAVPEPATWMMMLFGFGLVGSAMRRRKNAVSFA